MKKHYLFFIILIVGGLFFGLSHRVYGYGIVFISDIGPTNIQTGYTVNGILIIEGHCFGDVSNMETFHPIINFGEAPPPHASAPDEPLEGEPCICVPRVDSTWDDQTIIRCSYNFSHTYTRSGTFTVTPKGSSSSVIGSSPAVDFTGSPETVYVTAASIPTPHGNDLNPLVATGTAELIRQLTDRIFIYFSALAVLFVIIGGFTILTAAGSPTQVTKGKKIVLFTIIGYALILLARGIALLIVKILGINVTF
ncbi:pilin [Patescibacteria group bacterium]|nr:pilin [Patescibacteria group bacterium]